MHVEETAAQVVGRIHGLTTLNGNTVSKGNAMKKNRDLLSHSTYPHSWLNENGSIWNAST
jgi:hypothetical protein